jgi:hypothetical protein
MIARSNAMPEGMALIEPEDIVLQGVSSADGKLDLSADQQTTLQDAYCQHPGRLWLMYLGHAVRISVAKEAADWTEETRLRHQLSASDFSDDTYLSEYSDGMREDLNYARGLTETSTNSELVTKLKRD